MVLLQRTKIRVTSVFPGVGFGGKQIVMKNPLRQTAFIWLAVSIVGLVFIFVPGGAGIEGMSGGFAISFVCLFIAIIGFVVAVYYVMLAGILDRILRGDGLLVHWTYTHEKWLEYAGKEYAEEKAEKKGLFFVVSGFALFFGFLFWAIDPESGFYVFLIMLGLIAIVAFAWQFSAWYYHRQNMRFVGEVYISKDGVYLNQKLYTWRPFGSSLTSVALRRIRGIDLLVFQYSAFTYPPQTYTVRVPVPEGQEKAAESILQQFNIML